MFKNDLDNTICLSIHDCSTENNFKKIDGFQNYIISVFNSLKNYTYDININTYKSKIIITLSYNCSPIDFDLSKNILSDIFIKGYNISNDYFNNNPIYEKVENTDEVFQNTDKISENTDKISENTDKISENTDEVLDNTDEVLNNTDEKLDIIKMK